MNLDTLIEAAANGWKLPNGYTPTRFKRSAISSVARIAYEAGLERAKELVPKLKGYPFYSGRTNPDEGVSGFNYCAKTTLSALDDEINKTKVA